jgi:sugar/nucleoside kinase (ribokinase family)
VAGVVPSRVKPHERTGLSPEALCERGRGLIVTLGARGSCIYAEERRFEIPVAKPRTVRPPEIFR